MSKITHDFMVLSEPTSKKFFKSLVAQKKKQRLELLSHTHGRNVPFGACGHQMWCLSVPPGKKVRTAVLPKETVQKPESRRGTERSAPGFPASVWAVPAHTSRPSWPPAAPCFDYALLSWAAKAHATETQSTLPRSQLSSCIPSSLPEIWKEDDSSLVGKVCFRFSCWPRSGSHSPPLACRPLCALARTTVGGAVSSFLLVIGDPV